jgi:predicted O-methyltransferase YrrM
VSNIIVSKFIKTLGLRQPSETVRFKELFDSYIYRFNGWLEREEALFLHELAKLVNPDNGIVEIGSYEGKSTVALASGAREGVITYAIDPHTGDISEANAGILVDTYEKFISNIETANLSTRVNAKRMTSVEASSLYDGKPIGLLFIDGWHSTQAVVEDIESWAPFLDENAIIVFDDWNDPEVKAGIRAKDHALPPLLGAIGKELAFTNSIEVRRSLIGLYAKKMHRRLRVLNGLRRIKGVFLVSKN